MRELSLREIQMCSLEVLMDIDRVCRANSLKYCILFGTLIGAVRHKGFIPWDDDIDIGMSRNDYESFLKIYKEQGRFRIVNPSTEEKCPYMITRISDDRYMLESPYGSDYNIGAFVDIYPHDGVGNTDDSVNSIVSKSQKYSRGLAKCLEKNPVISVKKLHRGLKKWLLLPLFIIPKIIGVEYYREKLDKLRSTYDYENSIFVGCVCWALTKKEVFQKEWIEEIIEMNFEDKIVMAPKYYDEMLKRSYGKYMELPPEKDRVGHHFYKIFEK